MTIIEAIKTVLKEHPEGLTAEKIYHYIVEKDLYKFGAKNPKGVVVGEIRRHCRDLDFPTASPIKHFYVENFVGRKPVFNVLTDKTPKSRIETKVMSESALPEEKVQYVVDEYNEKVKEMIINKIMSKEPDFFEQMVVHLLLKMGYGYDDYSGQVVGKSHDGGIDGIINQDKLGLDLIYIQAKRYEKLNSIGRKEIQAFVGAMEGVEKGVFITTSKFTKEAKEYANKIQHKHIKLIDGNMLCEFMLKYGVGVQVIKTYELYKVDEDYFAAQS